MKSKYCMISLYVEFHYIQLYIIYNYNICKYVYTQGLSGKSPAIVNITRMVCTTSMLPGSQR